MTPAPVSPMARPHPFIRGLKTAAPQARLLQTLWLKKPRQVRLRREYTDKFFLVVFSFSQYSIYACEAVPSSLPKADEFGMPFACLARGETPSHPCIRG